MAMDEIMKYETAQDCEVRRPTVSESIRNRKTRLEAELAEVNQALAALEENPEVAKVVDLIAKVGRF